MNCLGIGTIIYDSVDDNWNFPHFHFVVYKDEGDEKVYAYCMELSLGDHADDFQGAVRNLIYSCNSLIERILKKGETALFDQLKLYATGDHNEEFWQAYRLAEIQLASLSRDLGNSVLRGLRNEINRLMREKEELKASVFTLEKINLINLEISKAKEAVSAS